MKKLLYFLLGSATLAFGAVLGIISKVGVGAFDALSYNGSYFYDISIGMTMNLHLFVLLILLLILKPSKRYVLGAVISFSIGLFIDLYFWLFTFPDLESFNFIYFIIALPFFPVGVAMMINSSLPVGPIEELPLLISERYKIKYVVIKTAIEVFYVALALFYGVMSGIGLGSIMIGTVIITLYIGPGIAYARKLLPTIE